MSLDNDAHINTIDAISVGGKTDFTKEQEFQSDDEVLIRYHGYAKCNELSQPAS